MTKCYYLISNAFNHHKRNKINSLREIITLILYFTFTILAYYSFSLFNAILNYHSQRVETTLNFQTVDTKPFLYTLLASLTYGFLFIFIGLCLFGIFQFTVSTYQKFLVQKNDLKVNQLTGETSLIVTCQFFIEEYFFLPITYAGSLLLSSFLLRKIIIGSQLIFPLEDILSRHPIAISKLFIPLSSLAIVSTLIVSFIMIYALLKQQKAAK